jgi:hypothetical protein
MQFAVVYDEGAASPLEIAQGLRSMGTVQFVVPDSAHVRNAMPLLRECGEVVMLDDASLRADAVLTFSERMLPHAARLAQALGLPGHSPQTVHALTDKVQQRQVLREASVDSVRQRAITDPAKLADAVAEIGLPAVVKPAHGEGSRCTFALTCAQDVTAAMNALTAGEVFVVEEMLEGQTDARFGDYVSVESVVVHGRVRHAAVTGKFPLAAPFRETGQIWPTHLGPGETREVTDLAEAALRCLGVRWGVCHTEIKLTGAGPRLLEVNGRLGGFVGELARRALGLDLIEVAGVVALGWEPELPGSDVDQVYFQYHHPVPLFACVLDGVEGVKEVEQMPGVDSYRLLTRPGAVISGGVNSARLDAIYGRAASHAGMFALTDAAADRLRFSFSQTDAAGQQLRHRLTGRQLMAAERARA